MQKILYTPFYGENLCNLISNEIINIFNSIDKNHVTEIYSTNMNEFIVLKGHTTISKSINLSEKIRLYFEDVFHFSRNFNFIDLISYSEKRKCESVYVLSNLFYCEKYNDLQKTMIDNQNHKTQGYVKINQKEDTILTNDISIISDINTDLNIINECDYNTYTSSKYYGSSLTLHKTLIWYSNYISYNLIEGGLCSDLTLELSADNITLEDFDWDNVNINVYSKSLIVNDEWLLSLIRDLFNDNINDIIKKYHLNEINYSSDILDIKKSWELKDKVSEIILI